MKKKLIQSFQAQTDEGNREIVFLANSGNVMASGEQLDLSTVSVRDPETKELVLVKDLKESDRKNFVPLMANHSRDVFDKVGQVNGLWLSAKGLMARAKIAHTEKGDQILTLAHDDMLDTFSVTVAFDDRQGTASIENGQLLEISVVWLGNDETTELESVNSRKETEMATKISENMTAKEADDLMARLDELKEAVGAMREDSDEPTNEGEPENISANETEAEATETAETPKQEQPAVAQNARRVAINRRVSQNVTVKSNGKAYLDSKQALADFSRSIVNNHRRGAGAVMADFARTTRKYGLNGDVLPTAIQQIFFKTWTDSDSVLSTFRTANTRQLDLYAYTDGSENGEGIRAKGHKKGEVKQDQDVDIISRTVRVKGIYKKLPIDLQDLIDDTTGELTRFRAEELAGRVANEIAVGAILGDGRSAASPDLRVFDGTRGLYSMAADIKASATPATNKFQAAVATELTAEAGESLWQSCVRALGAIRTAGRKVLILPFGSVTEILLAKDANGTPIFYPGTGIDQIFPNTRIFEMDEMVGNDYLAIAYADQAYTLAGEPNARVFTDFDITTNRDVMEVVRYVGGSLGSASARKIAAGIKAAGE